MNKEYLGDSVYIEFDAWAFVLTTENGNGPRNTIVLDPEVTSAMLDYIHKCNEGPQT